VFAPPSGRYLLVSGAGLSLLTVGVVLGWAPATVASGSLLAVGWGLWVFFAVFFRDPERTPGPEIVSAADGRVRDVTVEGEQLLISTFMNVTDVHVNRFPVDGRVDSVVRRGSGFRPAFQAAARHNVRCHYLLSTAMGPVEVIQMTGIVARRLVPLVSVGDARRKGDRLGMILLGSRVDVLLPADRVEALVGPGALVRAGVTPIAKERP
jgi:phosphatidylserine decarboxylase